MGLEQYLSSVITPEIASPTDFERFQQRITQGKLTRDENPLSHFCTMTVPYDPDTGKAFLVNHKKAKQWLIPGGHDDPDETAPETAEREGREELNWQIDSSSLHGPFSAQVLDIDNPPQPCREHYDLFFWSEASPEKIKVDPTEFTEWGWFNKEDALEKVTDEHYRIALTKFFDQLENPSSQN